MTTPGGPFTARLFGRLPEAHRDADTTDPGRPLLRYVAVNAGDADALEELVDRLRDLPDPERADAAWLPWLAQHVGATLPPDATPAARREVLRSSAGGSASGTRPSIVAAARTVLRGGRYAHVTDGAGEEFVITLRTIASETPSIAAVLAAVEQAGAQPAGFDVEVSFYSASWDTLERTYGTSASWDAVPSWAQLEETGAQGAQGPKALGQGAWGEGVLG